jgi:hypothetical protein
LHTVVGFIIIFFFAIGVLNAQQMTSGSSSHRFRDEASKSIPYTELTPEAREKLSDVIEHANMYRRLPVSSIEIDPEYFVMLARYPEVVVEIWRLMGVTQMQTARTGPFQLHSNDGAGTISEIELIYGTENYHLYYAEGSYEGPLNHRPLSGRCVLLLRTEYVKNAAGEMSATNQLDVFLKVDNAAAGLIARTLSPIVGRTADHNFLESLTFLQRLNETTERNGPGVQGMAYRLEGLSEEVRGRFIDVAGRVYERKLLRDASLSDSEFISSSAPAPRVVPVSNDPR